MDESDIGGIEVTSNNGRIVCNNSLAARLEYSVQKLLPDIRALLFSHQDSAGKKNWDNLYDLCDLKVEFIKFIFNHFFLERNV